MPCVGGRRITPTTSKLVFCTPYASNICPHHADGRHAASCIQAPTSVLLFFFSPKPQGPYETHVVLLCLVPSCRHVSAEDRGGSVCGETCYDGGIRLLFHRPSHHNSPIEIGALRASPLLKTASLSTCSLLPAPSSFSPYTHACSRISCCSSRTTVASPSPHTRTTGPVLIFTLHLNS